MQEEGSETEGGSGRTGMRITQKAAPAKGSCYSSSHRVEPQGGSHSAA